MVGVSDLFGRTYVDNPCYKCERRTAECHAHCEEHAEAREKRRAEKEEMEKRRREIMCADEYFMNRAEKSRVIKMNKNSK